MTILSTNWHLIHDNSSVITCKKSIINSKVQTVFTVFEADTYEECLNEIKRLNLNIKNFDTTLKEDYEKFINKEPITSFL